MPTDPDYCEIYVKSFHLRPHELEGVDTDFGSEPGEVDFAGLRLRVGSRPSALPLRHLTELHQTKLGNEYDSLLESYEPWIILYSIGIQDNGSPLTVARFGLRISLINQPRASVRSVFPETRLLDLGGGEWQYQTNVGLTGHLEASMVAGAALPAPFSANLPSAKLPETKFDISSSGKADVALNLKFRVLTPNIVTTGVHSDESAWTFTQSPSELLLGDQIVGHVLLLPRHMVGPLRVKARLFADIGLLTVFTWRFESDPLELEIPLIKPVAAS
jgi:hypothetical protein